MNETLKQFVDLMTARDEGFQSLARSLPQHKVLAVQMFRTAEDETIAIFTVVVDHKPVQYVVRGDSLGQVREEARAFREEPPPGARFALHTLAVLAGGPTAGGPGPGQQPTPGYIIQSGSVGLQTQFGCLGTQK